MDKDEKPRRNNTFRYIVRFFIIIIALIAVFFISFFVTLALRMPEEDLSKVEENSYTITNNSYGQRNSVYKTSSPMSLSEKYERLTNIEEAVAEKRSKLRRYVFLRDIPVALRQAVIAVEDKKFYAHGGFDIESILRATVVNVEAGEIEEGGSTITQQLAKNLFLTQERSFTRKVEELLLAISIERHFDKNKILEMYLNTIYFGSGFYGIYDAAQGYFAKEPKDLTVAECALLAGIPNAPSIYSPYVNFELAKKRQRIVIDAMVKAHFLTQRAAEEVRMEDIILADGIYY